MLNKLTSLFAIVGLFGIILMQYSLITGAYNAGYDACQSKYREELLKQQVENQQKEQAFNETINNLTVNLTETRIRYENTVNKLKSTHANELLKSEQRAELYKRYSEADKAKQRALAKHTARLDRSLTEGRELVKQLTEAIRIRDAQLRALGVYFQENAMLYE